MRRSTVSRGALRNLNLLALATLVAVGAFELGKAGAARGSDGRRRTAVVEAVKHAAPAVVSVYADSMSRRGRWRRGAGSGVIVHPDGYVITNSHVISGGQTVSVELFGDGGKYRAKVIADKPSKDLALLRIKRSGGFPYVSIAPTSDLMLGESAIAIGNPRGLGDTITVGVISALDRDAKISHGVSLRNLIQTDASINTGNSGGGLLNLDGELLGVIVSLLPQSTGIAFAIPGDQVRSLLQRALGAAPRANPLPPKKTPTPPVVVPPQASSHREVAGIDAPGASEGLPPPATEPNARTSGTRSSPRRPEDYGMTLRDTGTHIEVVSVNPGSAASLAGIHVGDTVLTIDGRPVESDLDIVLAFSASHHGRIYQVEIQRGSIEKRAALVTPR